MLMPYLHFQGGCEEALAFYASAFGGKIEHMSRYTKETGGPVLEGKVMHAFVSLGSYGGLSAADQETPVVHGESMELLLHCAAMDEAQKIYDALSQGGTQIQRFQPHPPPDDGGMGSLVQDKYGYRWIVTAPNKNKR